MNHSLVTRRAKVLGTTILAKPAARAAHALAAALVALTVLASRVRVVRVTLRSQWSTKCLQPNLKLMLKECF